jgi:hypothetical protein
VERELDGCDPRARRRGGGRRQGKHTCDRAQREYRGPVSHVEP